MSRDLLNALSEFAKRRQVSLVVLGFVCMFALVIWSIASGIASFQDEQVPVRIEPVVDNTFLGIQVADNTRDKYMSNAELRLAMSEAYAKSNPVRRYQMSTIWLQDGQHPETGAPAVVITVQPGQGEIPSPPFVPVAVRRWEPGPDEEFVLDELREMRRIYPPNQEDLDQLREVWSGGQYARSGSLFGSIRWLFVFVAMGIGLIIVAGAYRALAWRSTRWDRAADEKREGAALARLQAARDAK